MILSLVATALLVAQSEEAPRWIPPELSFEIQAQRSFYTPKLRTRIALEVLATEATVLGVGSAYYGFMYLASELANGDSFLKYLAVAAIFPLAFGQFPLVGVGGAIALGTPLVAFEGPVSLAGQKAAALIKAYVAELGTLVKKYEEIAGHGDSASLRLALAELEKEASSLTDRFEARASVEVRSSLYSDYAVDRIRLLGTLFNKYLLHAYAEIKSSAVPELSCFKVMSELTQSHSQFFMPRNP